MKPGLREKAVAVVAEGDPAVAVAVAAVAEAGTVTAVIAAAVAAETGAGRHLQ